MTERKVKNRFHYFLRRVFSAADSGPEVDVEINVPFALDELILRAVANTDGRVMPLVISDPEGGVADALVALPNQYVCTLALDGVGTLCSFTNNCYMKLDNTFKMDGRMFSGLQRFRILDAFGQPPVSGDDIASYFIAHLEFILYEK